MLKARYGTPDGPHVTPEQFMTRAGPDFKTKGIFPYCPSCKERVDPYGVHSPNVRSRFDHQNLAADIDPLNDCLEANRSARFRGMYSTGWDEERGTRLREAFFEINNVSMAYSFCRQLCRSGNLSVAEFSNLIRRADEKNIWAYEGIPLWVVPYVLLTLGNFGTSENSRFPFHFVMVKSGGKALSQVWEEHGNCKLKKVFSKSGEMVKTSDNPLKISEQEFLATAGDFAWVVASLGKKLVALG